MLLLFDVFDCYCVCLKKNGETVSKRNSVYIYQGFVKYILIVPAQLGVGGNGYLCVAVFKCDQTNQHSSCFSCSYFCSGVCPSSGASSGVWRDSDVGKNLSNNRL